jgi:trk system potassium uptake protein TrkH
MHLRSVFRLVAQILIFIAILMLIPTTIALVKHEEQAAFGFFLTIGIIVAVGIFVTRWTDGQDYRSFSARDGFLFTTVTWVLATAFGALPLLISGTFPDFTSCFFEIMSGFTTTGATTMTDIEGNYQSILFWRSMTNWLGGMGIVVLFVAFLPALGASAGTFHLMGAESVGPVKGKLTPKTQTTAMILWGIYLGFTILETIFLLFGGLSLYDAVTVSFSTLSAAGFCVKNSSIGSFNSSYVEVVVITFMLISGANFALYYKAFTGKIKDCLKNTELRWYLTIVGTASVLGAVWLLGEGVFETFGEALRKMSFHVISIVTTTGFATADYTQWPTFPMMLLFLVTFIGGCAGSAGGGVKVVRVSVATKSGLNLIKKKIHPMSVVQLKDSDGIVTPDVVHSIFCFLGAYMITWLIGCVIISMSGIDLLTCASATILTLGNIGIGFGNIGPTGTFAMFPLWAKWVFSFLMLVGRLELFTVYVIFSRTFWKR